MAIKSREVLVLGWSFLTFIFLLFGLSSNTWESQQTDGGTKRIGLWKECVGNNCRDRSDKNIAGPSTNMSGLEAAQGFATLCFLCALSCMILQVIMYWWNFRQHVLRVAAMAWLSALFGLIATSVYAGSVKEDGTTWGWGLPVFILGWIFELATGFAIYFVSRKPPRHEFAAESPMTPPPQETNTNGEVDPDETSMGTSVV